MKKNVVLSHVQAIEPALNDQARLNEKEAEGVPVHSFNSPFKFGVGPYGLFGKVSKESEIIVSRQRQIVELCREHVKFRMSKVCFATLFPEEWINDDESFIVLSEAMKALLKCGTLSYTRGSRDWMCCGWVFND